MQLTRKQFAVLHVLIAARGGVVSAAPRRSCRGVRPLPGRRDELTDLAGAFDDMLSRVAQTIDERGRFAANASHELRTPHAVMRTMLEVAQADPAGREIDVLLARLAETNKRSIRLTEALLHRRYARERFSR